MVASCSSRSRRSPATSHPATSTPGYGERKPDGSGHSPHGPARAICCDGALQAHLVVLECASCNANAGVRLGLPLSAVAGSFAGSDTKFSIGLTEKSGWLEDTKNTLKVRKIPP
jgi:hypothetical protein